MPSMNKRLVGFFALAVLVGLGLVARVLHIQYFNDEYKAYAEEQRKSVQELDPERGAIYDRDGNILAETVKVNSLYLYPYKVSDQVRLEEFFSSALNIGKDQTQAMLASQDKVLITERMSKDELERVKAANISGLEIETQTERRYPEGDLASHILGFLDEEGHGLYGLEAYYDELLYGEEGVSVQDKSPSGEDMPYESGRKEEAAPGSDLVMTIDPKIQSLVKEEGLKTFQEYQPKNMSIIVMDPNNGDVLAMENFPSYDPNQPRQAVADETKGQGLSQEELVDLCYDRWRSFSVSDVYEPGSVFKVITAASAYEEGVVDDSTILTCKGSYDEIEGVTLYCHVYPDSHGDQTLEEALSNSCNPAFIQVARLLGPEKMHEYIEKFGFAQPTGIGLPAEGQALIPESAEDFTEVRLATAGYGHGLAVTPIQMVTAISAVVNDGKLYRPRLVSSLIDGQTKTRHEMEPEMLRQVISPASSAMMREMMVHGVDHGTADGAKIPGYTIGGKTGTTEKIVDGEYSAETTVASFVGVYPWDKPEYVILAVADEPHGAQSGNVVTAPLVAEIIKGIIEQRGDEPSQPLVDEETLEEDLDSYEETEGYQEDYIYEGQGEAGWQDPAYQEDYYQEGYYQEEDYQDEGYQDYDYQAEEGYQEYYEDQEQYVQESWE